MEALSHHHKCKLCSRLFSNGRALGGHMKAHLTAPAEPTPPPPSSDEALYAPREPPRKNFGFSDPVFDIVFPDTDSKNPTHRKPPVSPEEDLAMCLMMLSRDRRIQIPNQKKKKQKAIQRMKKCEKCKKQFRSHRALFSHDKICQLETELEEEEQEKLKHGGNVRRRIFKCPFCYKLFGSGQALGGHKRSHLVSSTDNSSASLKLQISLIDLNLPAPLEEDDHYSVIYDV